MKLKFSTLILGAILLSTLACTKKAGTTLDPTTPGNAPQAAGDEAPITVGATGYNLVAAPNEVTVQLETYQGNDN